MSLINNKFKQIFCKKLSKNAIAKICTTISILAFSPIYTSANEYQVLPTVTVTGTYADFGVETYYAPAYFGGSGMTINFNNLMNASAYDDSPEYQAELLASILTILNTRVCTAAVSSNAKTTSSTDDVTNRWLTAQEVFNVMSANGTLETFLGASTLTFVMSGVISLYFFVSDSPKEKSTTAIPVAAIEQASDVMKPVERKLTPMVGANSTPNSSATKGITQEVLSRFNTSKNLREFVYFALQHPENGGVFYASQALKLCKNILQSTEFGKQAQTPYSQEKSKSYAAASSASSELRMKCSGFNEHELSDSKIAETLSVNGVTKDPLLIAQAEFAKTTKSYTVTADNNKSREKALASIFQTQDPLIIQDVGLRLAIQIDPASGKRGYWFDGSFYSLDSDTDVGLAIYMLPCGLGLTCNSSEFDVATRCAANGNCPDGRLDYVKSMLESKPGAYEKVVQVYTKMVSEISSKNSSAFIRPM